MLIPSFMYPTCFGKVLTSSGVIIKRKLLNVIQHSMRVGVRVKDQAVPDHSMKAYWRPRHQMDILGQLEVQTALPPGKTPLVASGGWVSPRTGLGVLEKRKISCTCRESKSQARNLATTPTELSWLPFVTW